MGVTWALTTVTTVFIVAVMFKLRGVLRKRYQKIPRSESPLASYNNKYAPDLYYVVYKYVHVHSKVGIIIMLK